MPKQREPANLLKAKGRKHYTKKDILERLAKEIYVPFTNIEAPKYLTKEEKKEFYDIAYKLLAIGVMTELDEEALARYIIAKDHYLKYSALVDKALESGASIEESAKAVNAQDKVFKQVRSAAADLGLTITSRCKLVVPKVDNGDVEL